MEPTQAPEGMNQAPQTSAPMQNQSTQTGNGKNTTMALLSYIGPLVIVPFMMAKQDPFVKFHIKQGLVVLGIEIVIMILSNVMWQLGMIWQLINLGTLVLSIMGIVHAVKGEEVKLPIIGDFEKFFQI